MENGAASRVVMAMVGKDRNQKIVVDPYLPLLPILTSHMLLQEESPEVNRLHQSSLIVNVILIVNVVRLPLAMTIMVIVSFLCATLYYLCHC